MSLDAQREKLRAYCKSNRIRLIDTVADEGWSASTLERQGLHEALRALKKGRADTLLVTKLDRLTRSVRDLCFLVDEYFGHKQYNLISLCGMANTHNAASRMMMLNIANYAQFERENNAERTREAMQHMKAQGVRFGAPRYGYKYSSEQDAQGRRWLIPEPAQQAVIERIKSWHGEGLGPSAIARRLDSEGIPAAHGGTWRPIAATGILEHAGVRKRKEFPTPVRVQRVCDKKRAAERARELRAEGLSLRAIGVKLRKEGLVPPRGGLWHAASVLDLLRHGMPAGQTSTAQRAAELRAQGLSLRAIALRLQQEGHKHARGSCWHAAGVSALLNGL